MINLISVLISHYLDNDIYNIKVQKLSEIHSINKDKRYIFRNSYDRDKGFFIDFVI